MKEGPEKDALKKPRLNVVAGEKADATGVEDEPSPTKPDEPVEGTKTADENDPKKLLDVLGQMTRPREKKGPRRHTEDSESW